MAADAKVIDAEIIDETPRPSGSVVQAASYAARSVASTLDAVGMPNAADKAKTVADVAESAQEAYDAARPAFIAFGRFIRKLEESKLLTYAERPPLRKPQ